MGVAEVGAVALPVQPNIGNIIGRYCTAKIQPSSIRPLYVYTTKRHTPAVYLLYCLSLSPFFPFPFLIAEKNRKKSGFWRESRRITVIGSNFNVLTWSIDCSILAPIMRQNQSYSVIFLEPLKNSNAGGKINLVYPASVGFLEDRRPLRSVQPPAPSTVVRPL